MNKIFLLVANYFNNYIGSFNRSKNKSKYGIGGSLLLIFGIVFVFLFTSMAITTMETAMEGYHAATTDIAKQEFLQMPLYVSVGMMGMFLMLLTVTKVTSTKRNTDDELLLSLPLKKSEIVISKILFNYAFDLTMILSTLLPQFVVYYIYSVVKPDILYFARCAYLLLVLPMLSNAIGSLFGYLFNLITKKFVRANAIRSVISVTFLVVFMLGYYALQFNMELSAGSDGFSIHDIVILKYLVNYLLGDNVIITLVVVTLVCLIPFLLCVIVSAASLGKNISAVNSKNKKLRYKKSSITKTLIEQEIGKYFSSSVYVMNTLFGGIILIILALMLLVVGEGFLTSKISILMNTEGIIGNVLNNIPLLVITLGCVILSTVSISASSISFEGKNIWILKSNPISYKKVFASKILTNFIICFACVILSSLFFGTSFILEHGAIGILYIIGYIVIAGLFSFIISCSGLFVNLIFPKLQWQSEAEIIKQSFSAGVALLVNMVLALMCILPIAIVILFTTGYLSLICIPITVLVEALLIIILLVLLNTIGKKLYNNL